MSNEIKDFKFTNENEWIKEWALKSGLKYAQNSLQVIAFWNVFANLQQCIINSSNNTSAIDRRKQLAKTNKILKAFMQTLK